MKKCICFSLFLLCAQVASSQVLIALVFGKKLNSGKLSFGLLGSPVLCGINGTGASERLGLNLGLYFDIRLNDRWSLHPEALPKSNFGADKVTPYATGNVAIDDLYADGSVTRIVRAMSLPVLVRYRVYGLLYAEAGIQADLITKGKDVFKVRVDDNKLNYDFKTSDAYSRLDMGYAVGVACRLSSRPTSMTLGLRYYGGLTDIMKEMPGTQRNSTFALNVYIPVGISGRSDKKPAP